jgi:hypothetical protein
MTAFKFGDLNQDRLADLMVLPYDGTARLLTNLDHRSLGQLRIGDVDFSLHNPMGAILDDANMLDLDKDHIMDLVYVSRGIGIYGKDMITVVCGKGVSEFKSSVTFASDIPSSPFSSLRLESLDLNRDGLSDLIMLDDVENKLILFLNSSATGISDWKKR